MSCKIFISHSSTDRCYADLLNDFLIRGLGMQESDIFCSSIPGLDIPIGVDFNEYILSKIKESSNFYTIAIISNSYYNSRYCLYELGAAWGIGKSNNNIIPFLVEDMDRGSPKDFIRYKQSVIGQNVNDINKLSDKLKHDEICIKTIPIEKFEKEREKLVQGIRAENAERLKNLTRKDDKSESKKQRIKLVAFDFDGTILQGKNYKHSWKAIWKFLNLDEAKRRSLFEKHYQNPKEYNFQDWCNECVSYFKDYGFKKEDITKIIETYELKLATNFEEVVRVLHAFGIKIIIISGGINTFIEETIDENLRDFIDEIIVNNFLYNREGYLEGVDAFQSSESDTAGKVKALEKYCVKNKISLADVAFVGDRMNDIDVLQVVGKPIVYPADKSHPRLQSKEFDFTLIHEDSLVHILPTIID